MKKFSRGMLAALAAAVAIPAGVALARNMEHGGWHRMSPETQSRLDEGRLAMARTALKLNADQEKLWSALETELRAASKHRAEKMAERQTMREERQKSGADGKDIKKPDMSERFEKMSQMMGDRAERMKAFSAAFKPFYASLSIEQKDVLRPLMRDLTPGGGRGHGHGGKRWAHGGSDEGGGWGHHRGGGRHGGRHEGRGGPMMDERGGGGSGGDGAGQPPAPQMMPDAESGDESPVPADKL
ncbi:MAG: Spy/CpxP family protein refolding chaperone [Hyphomicrobium sp.]